LLLSSKALLKLVKAQVLGDKAATRRKLRVEV